MSAKRRLIYLRIKPALRMVVVFTLLLAVFIFLEVYKGKDITRSPVEDDFKRYNNKVFRCIKVLDGDTLDIDIPDIKLKKRWTRIRLWGVDAPEVAHGGKKAAYYGYEAAIFARKLLSNKNIRLELISGHTRGYYGRVLAYVYLPDGRLFNKLLLEEGYAYADRRFQHPRMAEFIEAERRARLDLKGLWRGVELQDLPSWYKASWLEGFWTLRESVLKAGDVDAKEK